MVDDPVDLEEIGACFTENPHAVYRELRRRGPVHRVRLPGGLTAWLIVRYEEARVALSDPRFRKDWSFAAPELRKLRTGDERNTTQLFGRSMLSADPPDHSRLRKLVSKAFTPRRIEALRPRIEEMTDGLIGAMAGGERCDLMEALAYPLPISVICEILGVPSLDRNRFQDASNKLISSDAPTSDYFDSAKRLNDYLDELVAEKRRAPGDDVLSTLTQVTDEDGSRLSDEELRGTAFVLLFAGHETTVNLIGNATLALLTHPDQLAAVRDDWSLLDAAIEETLRWDGPVEATTWRFAAEDVTVGDTLIPGDGSLVLVSLVSANRDHGHCSDPDSFDISRSASGHLAFGHGIHFCLGAALARMESRIALRSLFETFPGLALDTPADQLQWRPGLPMRGLIKLPVVLGRHPEPATHLGGELSSEAGLG
ncbi:MULTISPECIES: cytochrome P450 [unclassified Streptomyces]|uniref:cytochrome P450 family protein n=1 Tax=unclassified Streptomyces TaxID=2593676 RepID=UPI00331F8936